MSGGEATISLTLEDYRAANWLRLRRRWLWRGVLRFVLLLLPIYTAIGLIGTPLSDMSFERLIAALVTAVLVAVAAIFALGLWLCWCVSRNVKRLYAQQQSARAPFQLTFNADRFMTAGPFETSNLPWAHFQGWLEDDRLFVLSKTASTFFCLSKAQLGEPGTIALRACLVAAGVKKGL